MPGRALTLMMIVFLIVVVTYLLQEGGHVVGEDDVLDLETEKYCSMVSLWLSQDKLPEDIRDGWPPYKGERSTKELCNLEIY